MPVFRPFLVLEVLGICSAPVDDREQTIEVMDESAEVISRSFETMCERFDILDVHPGHTGGGRHALSRRTRRLAQQWGVLPVHHRVSTRTATSDDAQDEVLPRKHPMKYGNSWVAE